MAISSVDNFVPNPIYCDVKNRVFGWGKRQIVSLSSFLPERESTQKDFSSSKWACSFKEDTKDRLKPIFSCGAYRNHKMDYDPEFIGNKTLKHTFTKEIFTGTPSRLPDCLFPKSAQQCSAVNGEETKLTLQWNGHNSWNIQYQPKKEAEPLTILCDPMTEREIPLIQGFTSLYKRGTPYRVTSELPQESQSDETRTKYLIEQEDATLNLHPNFCVITHDHSDHCSSNFISRLQKETNCKILVPKGNFKTLEIQNGYEFNWFDSIAVSSPEKKTQEHVTITHVPAHHNSRTQKTKWQETLWGGWIFQFHEVDYTLYVTGDTAWHGNNKISGSNPVHKEHHQKIVKDIMTTFPKIDFCIAPIDPPSKGENTSGQEDVHANTHQMIDFLETINPKDGVALSHWGSWPWNDYLLEPLETFYTQVSKEEHTALKNKSIAFHHGMRVDLLNGLDTVKGQFPDFNKYR